MRLKGIHNSHIIAKSKQEPEIEEVEDEEQEYTEVDDTESEDTDEAI